MSIEEKLKKAIKSFEALKDVFIRRRMNLFVESIDQIIADLKSMKEEEVCVWVHASGGLLGNPYNDSIECKPGSLIPSYSGNYKFCPYCGRKIQVKEEKEAGE